MRSKQQSVGEGRSLRVPRHVNLRVTLPSHFFKIWGDPVAVWLRTKADGETTMPVRFEVPKVPTPTTAGKRRRGRAPSPPPYRWRRAVVECLRERLIETQIVVFTDDEESDEE